MSRDMTKSTKWVCAQRRLRSGWASTQSDKSLRCAFSGEVRTQGFFMRTAETLLRLIWVFAGRTLSLLVLSCRNPDDSLFSIYVQLQMRLLAYTVAVHLVPFDDEPRHEKTCLCYMRTTKAKISLRIRAF